MRNLRNDCFWLWTISSSFAVLGLISALSIDNQLTVIKNDCYERLAIGQRLHPRDVYRVEEINTVPDCQQVCTKQEDKCKSFSFGISPEGNATCELSMNHVRETIDLKPIGTISDTDYDLYIKKLGCKLVIEQTQAPPLLVVQTGGPAAAANTIGYNTVEYGNPSSSTTSPYKPVYEVSSKPLYHNKPSYGSNSGFYNTRPPLHQKPFDGDEVHQVQTLISIRPSIGLNPVENRPGEYGSGPPSHLPPPEGYRPRPDDYNVRPDPYDPRPDPYDSRPDYGPRPNEFHSRPPDDYPRPGYSPDRVDSEYGRPGYGYEHVPDRYKPGYGDRPMGYPPRPSEYGSSNEYERPSYIRPDPFDRPSSGYGSNNFDDRPLLSGSSRPPSGYGDKPSNYRPFVDDRPLGYDDNRPYKPIIDTNSYVDRPSRPVKPSVVDSGYNSRPSYPMRPIMENNGYDSPSRPSGMDLDRPMYGPQRPDYYQNDRLDNPGYDTNRPQNPDRPDFPPLANTRPQQFRPDDNQGYGSSYGGGYSNYQPSKLTAIISDYDRLPRPIKTRPLDELDDYRRPLSSSPYGVPSSFHKYPSFNRPVRPAYDTRPYEGDLPPFRPSSLNHPYNDDHYFRPGPQDYDPGPTSSSSYGSQKPGYESLMTKPLNDVTPYRANSLDNQGPNKGQPASTEKDTHGKPLVSYNTGKNGERITSIITEIDDRNTCFRRALAGKRVLRGLVRRALSCERVEDCQRECGQEKRFVCEGFNYRLDPMGRGNGDCELLDMPLLRLDLRRDIVPDPDYDYYERNRNTRECDRSLPPPPPPLPPHLRNPHHDRDPPGYLPNRGTGGGNRRIGLYEDVRGRDPIRDRDPMRIDRGPRPSYGDSRRYYFDDKRGGGHYHPQGHSRYQSPPSDRYYLDHQSTALLPYRPQSYLPTGNSYLPKYDRRQDQQHDREKDRSYWGQNGSWGSYGGTYGNFGRPDSNYGTGTTHGGVQYQSAVVGLDRRHDYLYGNGLDSGGQYGGGYGLNSGGLLPPYEHKQMEGYPLQYEGFGYGSGSVNKGVNQIMENTFPVVPDDAIEHKNNGRTGAYNFLKDECSLRSATGFRFHKGLVKKYFAVPSIYECESLCFAIKEFNCLSYAFRYTVTLDKPTDNCYLSEKSYKQLDFYSDLQPDRDFDVYTMNNQKKCEEPMIKGRDNSDCFWHTRSGQRLDTSVVRDTLNVNSIVECQIECLKSMKFTCRAFSFRYGSPIIGGSVDNCQLTDWPFLEIDPRKQLIPEPGFEVYERGSYGHGCEPNHFNMKLHNNHIIGAKTDQLCYVGYGTPARLASQAIRKSVFVNTEFECKAECTKMRQGTLFQCMSFSFRSHTHRGEPNCDLSDIMQRDLLSDVDYQTDTDTWLFAWDNYNPECVGFASSNIGNNFLEERLERRDEDILPISDRQGYDPIYALDTWKVFSVSGWPCRRGSTCRENRDAGFWYCELEGGDANQWDYCCRPDHQCGYSEGFHYQWCYVGPEYTQWRKCSERYYPYIPHVIDRNDLSYRPNPYVPEKPVIRPPSPFHYPRPYGPEDDEPLFHTSDISRPGFRPDRPAAHPMPPQRRPSLNEYETEFHNQFLDPPKPGGFAQQPRFWPVSYLHRTGPPNASIEFQPKFDRKMAKMADAKTSALESLLAVIKEHNEKDIQFDIKNGTKMNEILYVKIPLPSNVTKEKSEKMVEKLEESEVTTVAPVTKNKTNKVGTRSSRDSRELDLNTDANLNVRVPLYRRGIVEKTNVTQYGKNL